MAQITTWQHCQKKQHVAKPFKPTPLCRNFTANAGKISMSSVHKTLIAMTTGILLTGCNTGTPECNSDDAKNLVVSIATEQLAKQTAMLKKSQLSGLAPKNIEQIRFSVNTVRTMQHQKSPEIYECAANLLMTGPEQSTTLPITYTVQQTDDRKQFLVNVVGL
ncbi:hypothetical protein [Pectobacterium brasiliense]|uniref:hypothetical protein n=1 Tax=Pectobacterium brasiliense TaxID=180957 RepID=UPI0006906E23|nr:hypothetical protein [Pectobacterium brasiliense]